MAHLNIFFQYICFYISFALFFRKGLTNLPRVIGEKNVKILSLQHNLICCTHGFENMGLRKLIFLDLYDNQVEEISGLESLENLRVLLFGKNKLKKITGIKSLTKLEILDLHGNFISQIGAGLNTLSELKVLNLAGNQIRSVEENDLEGLESLQELNLKKNRLKKIVDLKGSFRLQKLFLSDNEISCIEDIIGITKAFHLKEVSVDGNPIAFDSNCACTLVLHLPHLQILSHVKINEQVRKNAFLWLKNRENFLKVIASEKTFCGKKIMDGEAIPKASKTLDFTEMQMESSRAFHESPVYEHRSTNVVELSEDEIASCYRVLSAASSLTVSSEYSLLPSKPSRNKRNFVVNNFISPEDANRVGSFRCFMFPPIISSLNIEKRKNIMNMDPSILHRGKNDENCKSYDTSKVRNNFELGAEYSFDEPIGNFNKIHQRSRSASQARKIGNKKDRSSVGKICGRHSNSGSGKIREQGGDYLIEIFGRNLNIYGQGALRFVDRPWNSVKAEEVTTARFNYVSFGGICNVLGKLKHRFPNIEHFIFRETNITYLGQLNALADVQGFSSLQIDREGNPITEKKWRSYAIYRLAHWGLKTINGKGVTEEEVIEAGEEYKSLGDLVLQSLPENLLHPLLNRLRVDAGRSCFQQTAKQWLWSVESSLQSVVCKEALQWRKGTQEDVYWRQKGKLFLGNAIEISCSAIEKLQVLEARWSIIFDQLIRDTLLDYSQMDCYMKNCIQQLS